MQGKSGECLLSFLSFHHAQSDGVLLFPVSHISPTLFFRPFSLLLFFYIPPLCFFTFFFIPSLFMSLSLCVCVFFFYLFPFFFSSFFLFFSLTEKKKKGEGKGGKKRQRHKRHKRQQKTTKDTKKRRTEARENTRPFKYQAYQKQIMQNKGRTSADRSTRLLSCLQYPVPRFKSYAKDLCSSDLKFRFDMEWQSHMAFMTLTKTHIRFHDPGLYEPCPEA